MEYSAEFGVMIVELHPGGPAQSADLQVNDIITHVNNEPVLEADTLLGLITGTQPGETIEIQILRQGKEKTISVRVGERPIQQN